MVIKNENKLTPKRLSVSMSLDDLNTIVMAFDFVDFPFRDDKLIKQLRKIKIRLEHLCQNREIQEIDRVTERFRESIKFDLKVLENRIK